MIGIPGRGAVVDAASTPSSAGTSSPKSMPGRSSCTCAARPVCAWRTPPRSSIRSRRRCAQVIPPQQIASVVDNIGLPVSSINLTYGNSGTIGSSDADMLISLKPDHWPHGRLRPHAARSGCRASFPAPSFAFLPADIVSQILNFGVPAPIDIQIIGPSPTNRDVANQLLASLRHVPGLVGPAHPAAVRPAGVARGHRSQPRASSSASPSTTWPTICC